jgi:phosphoenolpyruvate-protein kinase (PTS system EI component)
MKAKGVKFKYLVGTMIEVPRGASPPTRSRKHAQFFSFGTNDLTQTALGVSRDDMGFLSSATPRTRSIRRTRSPPRHRPVSAS